MPPSGGRHGIRRRGRPGQTRSRPPPHAGPRAEANGGTMPTEAKQATVAELREELANARTMIVSEYRGLTVKEIAEIRRALRKQDVRYRVVKNRLMRIAAEDSVGEALSPLLTGPTAIAFGDRRGRDGQGRPRRDPSVQQDRADQGRRPGRQGDRRRRRDPPRGPAVARGPAGQAGRRDAGAGRRPWPACSPRPCATWAMPWRRSPSRSGPRRPRRDADLHPIHPTPTLTRRHPWLS